MNPHSKLFEFIVATVRVMELLASSVNPSAVNQMQMAYSDGMPLNTGQGQTEAMQANDIVGTYSSASGLNRSCSGGISSYSAPINAKNPTAMSMPTMSQSSMFQQTQLSGSNISQYSGGAGDSNPVEWTTQYGGGQNSMTYEQPQAAAILDLPVSVAAQSAQYMMAVPIISNTSGGESTTAPHQVVKFQSLGSKLSLNIFNG